jgi:hypothetical protein
MKETKKNEGKIMKRRRERKKERKKERKVYVKRERVK